MPKEKPKKLSSKAESSSSSAFQEAVKYEGEKFALYYHWLEENMPPKFFQEVSPENVMLIAHSLMGFELQDYFSHFHLKNESFVLCLDSADADLKVLELFQMYGIRSYRAFLSKEPPPFRESASPLRITCIQFTEFTESVEKEADVLSKRTKEDILAYVKENNPEATSEVLDKLLSSLTPSFIRSLTQERLFIAVKMFFRAMERDLCQYEIRYNEDWKAKGMPSMQIVLAWRKVPMNNFFYRLVKTIFRHNLVLKKINALHVDPFSTKSVAVMSLGIDGINEKAAWEVADIDDFMRELVMVKYFGELEWVEKGFVDTHMMSGNMGNLVKTMIHFVHQSLLHIDPYFYGFNQIEEAFLRHPELTTMLTSCFEARFNPEHHDLKKHEEIKNDLLKLVDRLDTGNEMNDLRYKNVLRQALNFIVFTLKTNFYRTNKTAFSFRLDPKYLDEIPFDRKVKFPELPFAIFFIKGMHYIGYHIRFKDLSRGGLRTVAPSKMENLIIERNNVFTECYNLAYTQQKKNKDIPEGGAKAVILMEPYERLRPEEEILIRELETAGFAKEAIEEKLNQFSKEHKLEYLYETQRSFIDALLPIINCFDSGKLKTKHIIDYYEKPEYIYLGPDENMHNAMIDWISNYSAHFGYKPGRSFITSKPKTGINHKEFGVTSLTVNTCMEEVLKYMGINPDEDSFTIKMTGGPDGDVAGNQILNLYKRYPKTAKLLALVDVSGTIYDPNGVDLAFMATLFNEGRPICDYPAEKLSNGGFLLDTFTKREVKAYATQTLIWRKENNQLKKEWISGSEMNHLLRHNVHDVKADIFIPAGGRPRTLNKNNVKEFTDGSGTPTAKAIIEGANLYLTTDARHYLEDKGVLIIKDSSANKGGVICSSFEVLFGLVLTEEEFLEHKATFMPQILKTIEEKARNEAKILLDTHKITNERLTDISDQVSKKINTYMYEILDYLKDLTLSTNQNDPFIKALMNYCPPFLFKNFPDRILKQIPDLHKKAIIACMIAASTVYKRGISWSPSICDILPLIID